MIPASWLFLNPIALAVYIFLLVSTALITYRRKKSNADAATTGRVALSFFFTLLTISVSTVLIGCLFFGILIRFFHLLSPGLGSSFLAVMLGPALCCVISAILSLYLASRVSRLFWTAMQPTKKADPPLEP
jgi:hypothetical protein